MYEIEVYRKVNGNAPLEDFLNDVTRQADSSDANKILYLIELLKVHGLAINNVRPHSMRPLKNDIYELRPGKSRVFFFLFIRNRIVLLHAYRKKSQKTPDYEIEKALSEMKDYKRRYMDE